MFSTLIIAKRAICLGDMAPITASDNLTNKVGCSCQKNGYPESAIQRGRAEICVTLWTHRWRCIPSQWILWRWCFHGVLLGALCVSQLMQLAINLFFKIGLAYWEIRLTCFSLKGNIVVNSLWSLLWITLAYLSQAVYDWTGTGIQEFFGGQIPLLCYYTNSNEIIALVIFSNA